MGYKCCFFNSEKADFDKLTEEVEIRFSQKRKSHFERDGTFQAVWQVCFANTIFDGRGIMVAFNISGDYETKYIDGPEFEERVKFWVNEGKSMGLDFDELQWKIHRSKQTCDWLVHNGRATEEVPARALMFFLPLGKISGLKEMHMHLFFLRLLYELHGTVDRYIELRQSLAKSHPFVSRIGTLILAERTVGECKSFKGTRHYATGAHTFLYNKSFRCVVLTANGLAPDDFRYWYRRTMKHGGTFNRDFIGPQLRVNWKENGYWDTYQDPIDEEYRKNRFDKAMAVLTQEYMKEMEHVSTN